MLSGADSFEDLAAFGRAKETWLRRLGLALPNGIPSHDTFRDLFRHLDPGTFQDGFTAWINAVWTPRRVQHVAIDGKAMRGSRGLCGTCLHLVSVWVGANSLTLGQVAVEDKSNEITAIPKLLQLLKLQGALVSIDALGCPKEIAQAIRATGADYLLQVKGNQPTLQADIQASFDAAFAADYVGFEHDLWGSVGRGHGRQEERVCLVLYNLERLSTPAEWLDLQAIVQVTRTRWIGDQDSFEVSYYISSRRGSAEALSPGGTRPLGDRKRLARGAGRGVRGGCQSSQEPGGRREPGDAAAHRCFSDPSGRQQRQHQRQVAPRQLGR